MIKAIVNLRKSFYEGPYWRKKKFLKRSEKTKDNGRGSPPIDILSFPPIFS
jgi:hypothetical protein